MEQQMPDATDTQTETPVAPAKPMSRGIYLLPNLFTTGAMFCGFYAVVASMQNKFEVAAIAVVIAMVLDSLDGRVARLTNTQTAFGAEYDSLSDLVSFGVAPSLIMYQWSLSSLQSHGVTWGKMGWLAAFIYMACAALRLARFNTQIGKVDKRFFVGLPSPAAAAMMISMVWACQDMGLTGQQMQFPALFLTLSVGLLMVSNISYYSFKDFNPRNRVPFVAILVVVLVLALVILDPPKVLFVAFSLYTLSGPALWLWRRYRRAQRRRKGLEA